MSIIDAFFHATFAGKLVLLILICMSIVTWALIVHGVIQVRKTTKHLSHLSNLLSKVNFDVVESRLTSNIVDNILKRTIRLSLDTILPANTSTEIKARGEVIMQQANTGIFMYQKMLTVGVPLLGTFAAIAPYIGLFGTVWGIINSLSALGTAQSVSLQAIAPGMSEALIATGVGLVAAIPASAGYNYLTKKSEDAICELINLNERVISVASTTRIKENTHEVNVR
ncbi:MotA/TolQ/ExbB proton channel family protein [Photobacterium kishitanii]|uniref:Tol-Pal system subunit TolQ n=1 Tax=Photobacterium kishitanii TaxID=318456 RepID=A0A2T3KMS9_9GAMM|nr:MotA/TolQ/ExbB proton channel family protein [Photobacterium kishitanii]PSV01088.1 Tol-Pal system subunit TolQ [Photobacterium kishitanii]